MKRAPRSRQRHDLYAKYHDYDSEISDLLGECGIKSHASEKYYETFIYISWLNNQAPVHSAYLCVRLRQVLQNQTVILT
jgi:hypothetical protein